MARLYLKNEPSQTQDRCQSSTDCVCLDKKRRTPAKSEGQSEPPTCVKSQGREAYNPARDAAYEGIDQSL